MTTGQSGRKPDGAHSSDDEQPRAPTEHPPSGYHRKVPAPPEESAVSETDRPRARGGWTVLEQFVHDGYCYRVTRRPIEPEAGGLKLAKREEQALAYAHAGHSNKSIADMLGVAPSTVGVLLFRAATKVGARSRRELLEAYARMKAKPEQE
jgi:DNA-binding CsgD family transcriptional regulator